MDRLALSHRSPAPAAPLDRPPAGRCPSQGSPGAATGTGPSPRGPRGSSFHARRIAENGAVCGVSIGSTYGTMAALASAMRAHPGTPRSLRMLAAFLPAAGVAASPYVEDRLRRRLGATPTYPVLDSLEHDAVASAGLLATHHLTQRVPALHPPAATPLGLVAGVTRAAVASVVAGALSEASGQASHLQAQRAGLEPPAPSTVPPHHKSLGRSASLLPSALMFAASTWRGAPLSPDLAARVITGGWAFRRVLTPAAPAAGEAAGPGSGRSGHPPEPAPGVAPAPTDIPTIPPA